MTQKSLHQSVVGTIAMISVENNQRNHGYERHTALFVARGQLRNTAQIVATAPIDAGHSDIFDALQAKADELDISADKVIKKACDSLIQQAEESGNPILETGRVGLQSTETRNADSANGSGAERVGGHTA